MIHLEQHFRAIITLLIILLIGTSLLIWTKTPDLFQYFNQAFCPH